MPENNCPKCGLKLCHGGEQCLRNQLSASADKLAKAEAESAHLRGRLLRTEEVLHEQAVENSLKAEAERDKYRGLLEEIKKQSAAYSKKQRAFPTAGLDQIDRILSRIDQPQADSDCRHCGGSGCKACDARVTDDHPCPECATLREAAEDWQITANDRLHEIADLKESEAQARKDREYGLRNEATLKAQLARVKGWCERENNKRHLDTGPIIELNRILSTRPGKEDSDE